MATCDGCGAELAASWKYCIHCGKATGTETTAPAQVPGAIRPEQTPTAPRRRASPFLFVVVALCLAGIVLLGIAIAFLAGALH
jgi:uncharacterized membrane protein YvbJ